MEDYQQVSLREELTTYLNNIRCSRSRNQGPIEYFLIGCVSSQGDLIWFDPGVGYSLPGEVVEFSKPAGVIIVQVSSSRDP